MLHLERGQMLAQAAARGREHPLDVGRQGLRVVEAALGPDGEVTDGPGGSAAGEQPGSGRRSEGGRVFPGLGKADGALPRGAARAGQVALQTRILLDTSRDDLFEVDARRRRIEIQVAHPHPGHRISSADKIYRSTLTVRASGRPRRRHGRPGRSSCPRRGRATRAPPQRRGHRPGQGPVRRPQRPPRARGRPRRGRAA